MLSKLLKHEFRATSHIMLPLYLILLVTSVFTNILGRILENHSSRILVALNGLCVTAFGIAVAGVSVMTLVLMVVRFYKNYMTDEGYLMFTLPVSNHQLIFSKVIVSLAWFAATLAMDIFSVLLAVFRLDVYSHALQEFSFFFDRYGKLDGNIVGYCAELLVILLLSAIGLCLMVYAAIALGHSFASKKILLSVVFFFAFDIGLKILGTILIANSVGRTAYFFFSTRPLTDTTVIHVVLLIVIGVELVLSAIFYVITYFTLQRRLNLQ